MQANFRIISTDYYPIVDAMGINDKGLYSILVAGWDIDQYCKNMKYQKRHVLSRIEKVRHFLESNMMPNALVWGKPLDGL